MELIKSVATSFKTCVSSDLKVHVPNRIYFGGELLEGIITLDISQPIDSSGISLSLRGVEKTKVKIDEKGKPPSVEEHIFISTSKRYSITPEGSTGIAPGKYYFVFAYKLPPMLPASLKNDEAEIKYEVNVNADIQPLFELNDTIPICMGGNIFDEGVFTSDATTVYKANQKDIFWGGTVQAEATLPKSKYFMAEEIPIQVKIENRSGQRVRGVRVEIKCDQTCTANSYSATTAYRYKQLETFEVPVLKYTSRTETLKFTVPPITPTILPFRECNKNITWKCWLVLIIDIKNAPDFEIYLPITVMRRNPHVDTKCSEEVTCHHCQTTIRNFRYKCDSCDTSLCFVCFQIPNVHSEHATFNETSCIPKSQIEQVAYVDMEVDKTNKVLKVLYPVGSEVKHYAGVAACAALEKISEGITMAAVGGGFNYQSQ